MAGRPKKQINEVARVRFAKVVDELKTKNGISQAKLGERIHVSQQTISKLKRGDIEVSPEYAQQIAEEFPQYRAEWLLGLDEFQSPNSYLHHMEATLLREGADSVDFGLAVLEELYFHELMTARLGVSNHLVRAEGNHITGFTFDDSGRRLLMLELLSLSAGWRIEWLGEDVAAPMAGDEEEACVHPYVVMIKGGKQINLSADEFKSLADKICGFFDVELAYR